MRKPLGDGLACRIHRAGEMRNRVVFGMERLIQLHGFSSLRNRKGTNATRGALELVGCA